MACSQCEGEVLESYVTKRETKSRFKVHEKSYASVWVAQRDRYR